MSRGMLRLLLPRFDAVIFTRYLNNPRAVEVAELDALAAEISPHRGTFAPIRRRPGNSPGS